MSEWHEVAIGSISTLKKGVNYKSEDYCDEGTGYPFITNKSFAKGGGYESSGLKYFNGYFTQADQLTEGDIIFSMTDLTRAGDVVGSPLKVPNFGSGLVAIASMDCMRINPIDELCDRNFLYHQMMLSDVRRRMVALSAGSTVLHLNTKKILDIVLYIPEKLSEQQRIAKVLDTIDRTIAKTEALIKKYQQIKAGLMHDLFTRGIGADGKLRPRREEAPELYRETAIGWIPKKWKLLNLYKIAEIIDPQPDHRTPPEHPEGIPYIGIGDFNNFGDLEVQKCRKVTLEAFEKQKRRFTTKSGDIIYGKIGTIGKPKILPNGYYALSANVILIKPRITPLYVRHYLDSKYFVKQIFDITNTTSQPALGIEKIRNTFISVPNRTSEIEYISDNLNTLDIKIFLEKRSLQKLNQQKSGLMHDLLTGKVSVNVDSDAP